MLKIRLQKVGKRNSPSFRVVLVEHTFRPQGKFLELLGSYNKVQKQKNLNKERILYWISKGAQVSPTMHNMLVDEKIIDEAKVKSWKPKKRKGEAPASAPTGATSVVKEEAKEEEKTAPTPAEGEVGVPTENVGIDEQPKTE